MIFSVARCTSERFYTFDGQRCGLCIQVMTNKLALKMTSKFVLKMTKKKKKVGPGNDKNVGLEDEKPGTVTLEFRIELFENNSLF
jgi:hypothetical protein